MAKGRLCEGDLDEKRDILTLQSPVVTICTARFNIKKFYVLPTQCIFVFILWI